VNFDRIKEIIDKVPITLILLGYLGYVGFQYYEFENDDASPKMAKMREITGLKDANKKYESQYKELNTFVRSLEQKKIEMRELAKQLQEVKAGLSEDIDVPGFMKMVTTEGKKLNLSILALKPIGHNNHEFYGEVNFSLTYRGVFLQLVAFLERLSSLSRIIQIDKLIATSSVVNSGTRSGQLVLLNGEMNLKVFKYIGSHEDTLGRADANSNANPASTPSAISKALGGGVGTK